ncbi:AzlC family ABC transporter permease [Haloterrigena salifodinae]|uniref:AzlC family ABC transporter permease n=1 Tax=Haloterrigena salifodinae TaxID=2675099 RepID=A0A8T8E3F4_9EURY|nr:AzlC family ABC transporter permease [Haloterrigena salifodinae]QRV16365.1 AzlC family ABC transporter permease [Haloterrigena salifodinae]
MARNFDSDDPSAQASESSNGGDSDATADSGDNPTDSSTTATTPVPDGESVTFGWDGLRAGFLACLPVAVGVGGYGVAFGVLANQAGLSLAEAALMSMTVFAGASQIIAVELWADPLPIAAIVATTFAVNVRYALMGAALQSWFRHLSPGKIYSSLVLMADENWALSMQELASGSRRGSFLLGSGVALWLCWVASTVLGVLAGESVGDPAQYGVDFILAAVFVALAVELWDGRSTLVPWLVALATSVLAANVLSGQWYIPLGGFAAAVVEVVRHDG